MKITKTLFGYKVNYQCPKCGTGLVSSLKEAGLVDKCPDCSSRFKVPGEKKLAALLKEESEAKAQREENKKNQASEKTSRKAKSTVESEPFRQEIEKSSHALSDKNKKAAADFDRMALEYLGPLTKKEHSETEPRRTDEVKVTAESRIACKFCRELILSTAIKCRYCGECLDDRNCQTSTHRSNAKIGLPEKTKTHPLTMLTAVIAFGFLFICCGGLGGGNSRNTPSGQRGGGTGSSYSSAPRLIRPDTDQWLVVNTEAHWGPSDDAKVVGKMNRGAVVTVAKDDGSGWVEVYGFAAAIYKSSSWIRYPDEFLDIRQNVFVRKKHLTPSPPGF